MQAKPTVVVLLAAAASLLPFWVGCNRGKTADATQPVSAPTTATKKDEGSNPVTTASQNQLAEKYELQDSTQGFELMTQLALTELQNKPDGTGDVEGKVVRMTVGSKPLELETNQIVHEDNKAWIVTKKYGKIRISGGFEQRCPPMGLCAWMTPSQKAQLKALYDAK